MTLSMVEGSGSKTGRGEPALREPQGRTSSEPPLDLPRGGEPGEPQSNSDLAVERPKLVLRGLPFPKGWLLI